MSKIRTITGAILFGLLPFTALAQEECVSIENDVARLECFDNAFASREEASKSPKEAFSAFYEFGFADGFIAFTERASKRPGSADSMISYKMEDRCHFSVLSISAPHSRAGLLLEQSSFDLTKVQSFSPDFFGQMMAVSMQRGSEVETRSGYIYYKDLPAYRFSGIDTAWNFQTTDIIRYRSEDVFIAAAVEDRQEAMRLFGELVEACKAN